MNKLHKYLFLGIITVLVCCNKQTADGPELNNILLVTEDTVTAEFFIGEDWLEARKLDNEDENNVSEPLPDEWNQINSVFVDKSDSIDIASRVDKIRKLRKSEGELDVSDQKNLLELLTNKDDPDIQLLPKLGVNNYLTVHLENDIFSNRDWYYTNGVRIEFTDPVISRSPISYILLPYKKGSINFHGIALGQNIFTPLDPDIEQIPYGDRPFSAYMYFGQYKVTNDLTRNYRQISEFNLGIIGPASLGGYFLRSVHHSQQGGWSYQVSNDIIVNYHARFEKTLLNSKFINIDGVLDGNLGTLHTNIGAGATVRTGLFNKRMFNMTSPDTWNQLYPISGRFQFFLYYKIEGRMVGYDATLQGGLFNKSVYFLSGDQINRAVYDQQLGFVASLSRLSIKLVQVWLSPEFKGGLSHKWMEVSFSVNL